jgi:hypothetical protein
MLQCVHTAISDTCDPLHRLPVELVFQVFGYLHPFDVWSLRRTCRRWNEQLSSTQLMRDAVNRFATEHPSDSALDKDAATPSTLALELRHVLALRLARPFTHVYLPEVFDTSLPAMLKRRSEFQLKGGHLAYIRSLHHVVVRDLISGGTALLCGEAREHVIHVALSDELVAFATYTGMLYVAWLKDLTAPLYPVRLPSSNAIVMAAEGGIVACVLAGSHPVVVVYKAAFRKSTFFDLGAVQDLQQQTNPKTHLRVCAMSINEGSETVDIAAIVSPSEQDRTEDTGLRVVVLRFSFAGEYIMQVAWEQQIPGLRHYSVFLGPFKATGERGVHKMELVYNYHRSRTGIRDVRESGNADRGLRKVFRAELTFLFDDAKISLKSVDHTISVFTGLPGWASRPLFWKDRLYRTGSHTGPMTAFLTASRSGTPHGPAYDGPHTLQRLDGDFINDVDDGRLESEMNDEPPDGNARFWPRSIQKLPTGGTDSCHEAVAMNESFVVTECSDAIEVACFDERVELYGAKPTKLWDPDHEHPYSLPSLT